MNRATETQRPTVRTVPLTGGAVILLLAAGIVPGEDIMFMTMGGAFGADLASPAMAQDPNSHAAAQFGGGGGGNRRRRRTQPTGASAHPADGGVGAPSRRGRRRTQ